jgi:hypothetical protein
LNVPVAEPPPACGASDEKAEGLIDQLDIE